MAKYNSPDRRTVMQKAEEKLAKLPKPAAHERRLWRGEYGVPMIENDADNNPRYIYADGSLDEKSKVNLNNPHMYNLARIAVNSVAEAPSSEVSHIAA